MGITKNFRISIKIKRRRAREGVRLVGMGGELIVNDSKVLQILILQRAELIMFYVTWWH